MGWVLEGIIVRDWEELISVSQLLFISRWTDHKLRPGPPLYSGAGAQWSDAAQLSHDQQPATSQAWSTAACQATTRASPPAHARRASGPAGGTPDGNAGQRDAWDGAPAGARNVRSARTGDTDAGDAGDARPAGDAAGDAGAAWARTATFRAAPRPGGPTRPPPRWDATRSHGCPMDGARRPPGPSCRAPL